MLIRYMGEKPKKVLELNRKVYEFSPVCEVEDKEALKFLLSDERKGLFKAEEKIEIPAHPTNGTPALTDNPAEQPPKGRGRPRKG